MNYTHEEERGISQKKASALLGNFNLLSIEKGDHSLYDYRDNYFDVIFTGGRHERDFTTRSFGSRLS